MTLVHINVSREDLIKSGFAAPSPAPESNLVLTHAGACFLREHLWRIEQNQMAKSWPKN